jgi:uncharacterized membrane protein YhaH (DUF805 family)
MKYIKILVTLLPLTAQLFGVDGGLGKAEETVDYVKVFFQTIAVAAFTIAFLVVAIGMGFGSKRWHDVANVFYAALIAGMAAGLATFLVEG